MDFEGYVVDIEANGFVFQADVIWTIVLKDINDPEKKLVLNPYKDPEAYIKFKSWHESYDNPIVAGHYILGYDMFVLLKILEVEFTVSPDSLFGKSCTFIDTLYLSQYIDPDIDGHSLEDWGQRLGLEKIDYFQVALENGVIPPGSKRGDEFSVHHQLMDEYCERDVDVNIQLLERLWGLFVTYYQFENDGKLPSHYRCGQKSFFLMSCQEFTGWKFDQKLAAQLVPKIQGMMQEIEKEVLPKLPPRKLKKTEEKEYTMPAKPFKQNLEFSSHMLNFIEKHEGKVIDSKHVEFYGEVYKVESKLLLNVNLPMEMKDGDDLKGWFISQGWKPTLWNYKRGSDGKPMRDDKGKLIPTSPKIQEAQKICPNLLALDGDIPKQVVKFLSLRNRLSVLTGWMENPRLAMDGRIGASRTGVTPTHRQKHSVVVNVPKASDKVLLGKEFRSLWIAEDGMKIAAGDAAALEGRVMGHYSWKYDNGATAEEILNGDPHSKNAQAFFPDETGKFDIEAEDFNKDEPGFKPYRDRSKNGFYALNSSAYKIV
jgi:hypothetical protein